MIFLTITFELGTAANSMMLYLLFWISIVALCVRLMIQFGNEFVLLPTLCPPYIDPSPFTTASKSTTPSVQATLHRGRSNEKLA